MKVTVCELPIEWSRSEESWSVVAQIINDQQSDLVLLPEMPFYSWLPGSSRVDPARWERAVAAHDRWITRLEELRTPIVIGSRPCIDEGHRFNQGFIWENASGVQPAHTKYYLPNEEGFWEATWYRRGDGRFEVIDINGMRIGFLICTELWFQAQARAYAHQGVHLLVCPRATPQNSTETWVCGGRTAAIVAGAFCLSSNFNGPHVGDMNFGGTGWVIEPEAGHVLGLTSPDAPFLTMDIDMGEAEQAKQTYPRYVPD